MFGNCCSNIGLKNIQLVTRHLASRNDVNVDFSSPLCQIHLHTSMRTKEFKIKMKYCGIHLMGQQERYVPSWLYQEDPWVASTSIHIIHPS
jgi:hypothetical protein